MIDTNFSKLNSGKVFLSTEKVIQSYILNHLSYLKGSSAALRDNRPSIEGYSIKENEYCAEATYNNNATTIQEAVSRCSSDPNCAAVEDRFGSGRPPLGLCKKFKGKISGAGSYLLRRGTN